MTYTYYQIMLRRCDPRGVDLHDALLPELPTEEAALAALAGMPVRQSHYNEWVVVRWDIDGQKYTREIIAGRNSLTA